MSDLSAFLEVKDRWTMKRIISDIALLVSAALQLPTSDENHGHLKEIEKHLLAILKGQTE